MDQVLPRKPRRSPAEVAVMARAHAGLTALALAVAAAAALAFAPIGVREEMFGIAYAVEGPATAWAPALAVLALVLGGLALLLALFVKPRAGFVLPVLALLAAGGVLAGVRRLEAYVAGFPPVHDVATDWSSPLMFGAGMIAERGPGAMPVRTDPRVGIQPIDPRMEGHRVAELNAEACPKAQPLLLPASVDDAYTRTLAAMKAAGLVIFSENPAGGRIEATGVDRRLKLKSDVIARIRVQDSGSRIDFRSISRTGEVDLGENCRQVMRLRELVAGDGRPEEKA